MRVAVIGAGPSGLTTLKSLVTAHNFFACKPIEAKLFESAAKIGGIFYHHTYEEGEMVSSKFLTAFSDFRARLDDPDFLSTDRYVEYMNDYATVYDLWKHINLSTRVLSVHRNDTGGHVITYTEPDGKESTWECDAIAVCSGLHVVPNIPHIDGIEKVPVVMHSEKFKSRKQFGIDKTILIVGFGETAADIGHLAITGRTKQVIMCHRDGFMAAPKVFIPFPNDLL
jgi:dimethylaniline monooxygenase (N-oxide forming)